MNKIADIINSTDLDLLSKKFIKENEEKIFSDVIILNKENGSVSFKKENTIPCSCDFRFYDKCFWDIEFYPIAISDSIVQLIGNGFGVTKEYNYKIPGGKYGNGTLFIFPGHLPSYVLEFLTRNIVKKIKDEFN